MTDETRNNGGGGRREFLRRAGLVGVGMSTGVLAACAQSGMAMGTDSAGMSDSDKMAGDVQLLNVALGLEYQAIAAYQVGALSGLLKPGTKRVAVEFQSQHKAHAAALKGLVRENSGKPIGEKAPLSSSAGDLASAYGVPAGKIHSETDVIRYAAGLEEGAAKAYLGTIAKFHNRDLAHAAASIEGDETMHWAILRQALGLDPVPTGFIG